MSGRLYRGIRSKEYLTGIQMSLYSSSVRQRYNSTGTIPLDCLQLLQIVLFLMHILQVMKSIGPVNNSVPPHKHDLSLEQFRNGHETEVV